MSGIECPCGARPLPTPSVGGTVTCGCGLRYTVTVDIETVYRRTREMACDIAKLAKLDPAAAMARPVKAEP